MKDVPEEGARILLGGVVLLLLAFAVALLKHAGDEPMQMFGIGLFVFSLLYIFKLVGEQFDAIDARNRAARAEAATTVAVADREAA